MIDGCGHPVLGGEAGGVWCRNCGRIWESFGAALDTIPEKRAWGMTIEATYVAEPPADPDTARQTSRVWLATR